MPTTFFMTLHNHRPIIIIMHRSLSLTYFNTEYNQYIKIFIVCVSVRDGCGRGNSLKLLLLGPQRVERDERHAIVDACHRTSNGQEHKIIRRAEPEKDTIFHVRVTACRGRGSHSQDERLAWVASRGQGTSCSSSFVSKVLGANYKRANNFLPVAHKFTMYIH